MCPCTNRSAARSFLLFVGGFPWVPNRTTVRKAFGKCRLGTHLQEAHVCTSVKEGVGCGYQVLIPRSCRLIIVVVILEGRPVPSAGSLLEIAFIADPRECGNTTQATSVRLHTQT